MDSGRMIPESVYSIEKAMVLMSVYIGESQPDVDGLVRMCTAESQPNERAQLRW